MATNKVLVRNGSATIAALHFAEFMVVDDTVVPQGQQPSVLPDVEIYRDVIGFAPSQVRIVNLSTNEEYEFFFPPVNAGIKTADDGERTAITQNPFANWKINSQAVGFKQGQKLVVQFWG